MNNVELALMVTASYLFFLWFYGRLRILRGRDAAPPLALFRRLDREAVVRELNCPERPEALPPIVEALRLGRCDPQSLLLVEALPSGMREAAQSALWALSAEQAQSALARFEAAAQARRSARSAGKIAPGVLPEYLDLHVTMAFLTDGLNLEWVIFRTGRALRRLLSHFGTHPLPHLESAHREALRGEPAECIAALARAFFHARDDRFIAELIVASPAIAEKSPALAQQAQRALARLPPAVR
jgi:hypothetical protein